MQGLIFETALQAILSTILSYERLLLSFVGSTPQITNMQKLLGIKITASQDHRHTEVVATTSVLPNWNTTQANDVCDVATFYKIADVIALVSDVAERQTNFSPPVPLTVLPTGGVKQFIEKLGRWKECVQDFKKGVGQLINMPEKQTNGPASVYLFKALHKVDTSKRMLKVLHNFLLVAALIAYMKDFTELRAVADNVNEVPDLEHDNDDEVPDLTFQHFDNRLHPTLSEDEVKYLQKLTQASGSAALRFALQLALFISPLVLLFALGLEKRPFDRNHLMRLSLALGADKPESILKIEKMIWETVLAIVEDSSRSRQLLELLANKLPDIDTLPAEDVDWFRERLAMFQPDSAPLSPSSPSMPLGVPLTSALSPPASASTQPALEVSQSDLPAAVLPMALREEDSAQMMNEVERSTNPGEIDASTDRDMPLSPPSPCPSEAMPESPPVSEERQQMEEENVPDDEPMDSVPNNDGSRQEGPDDSLPRRSTRPKKPVPMKEAPAPPSKKNRSKQNHSKQDQPKPPSERLKTLVLPPYNRPKRPLLSLPSTNASLPVGHRLLSF